MNVSPIVVYVDVDDTFVRSFGSKRTPIPAVIEHIKMLREQGAELYCWSSGGAVYAKNSASEYGILDCFVAFLPKPNVLIDDQVIGDWRRLLQVHPTSNTMESVEDFRLRLSAVR